MPVIVICVHNAFIMSQDICYDFVKCKNSAYISGSEKQNGPQQSRKFPSKFAL